VEYGRDGCFGISKALILVRGIGFLSDDNIRVYIKEVLVPVCAMPDLNA
jgi:hypothetical protein